MVREIRGPLPGGLGGLPEEVESAFQRLRIGFADPLLRAADAVDAMNLARIHAGCFFQHLVPAFASFFHWLESSPSIEEAFFDSTQRLVVEVETTTERPSPGMRNARRWNRIDDFRAKQGNIPKDRPHRRG